MTKSTTFSRHLFLCLCSVLWLGCVFSLDMQAQTCAPLFYRGWIKNEVVKVYIDPTITGDRRSAVEQAFTNWNANSGLNGSGIYYQFVSQPPATNTGFTVLNRQHESGARETTDFFTDDYTGHSTSATTYLAPTLTNPAAVLEAMAHGIGHPAGFRDCDTCAPSDSVMATSVRYTNDNDVIGRATSPTNCDNAAIASNYPGCTNTQEQYSCESSGRFWNPDTCLCVSHHGGGGGGGGYIEPEQPCTHYEWVYYESYDGGRTWHEVDREYAGCW